MAKGFFVLYRTPVGPKGAVVQGEGKYWPAEMAGERQIYCYPIEGPMMNESIDELRVFFDAKYAKKKKQDASQETNG